MGDEAGRTEKNNERHPNVGGTPEHGRLKKKNNQEKRNANLICRQGEAKK